MTFDDRTARRDDSPKSRVLAIRPDAKCVAVYWAGRRDGYVVEAGGVNIGTGRSAWDAWRQAEEKLAAATREK